MSEQNRQREMFHETIEDAIGTAIMALGGYKKVAGKVFSNKRIETAYAHLKNCLRDDKPEKLDPHELMLIAAMARDIGEHAVVEFINRECGYAPPVPVQPQDELAALQRQYIAAAKDMARLAERIERAQVEAVSVG